ncbi:ribonuclease D [Amorphus orientalis]|uniref:Ribonuclease D n=1 Tax=Amorphus orientalis TaxID=649198 RepID=A0AAE3VNB3_9HYPH|nr:ribonuclease D [Amorphus orientalis]MDQ0315729.1 ribonuclease D [Amorphus orientalis]
MNLITTTSDLEAVCERLADSDFVTVDTEFMRETTFWPKLCLIQMAGPDETVIVDPVAGEDLDLAPFFRLMADESVTKVFHAARQDIEIVFHLGGLVPHPVFDTQVAAMVCGFGDSISYDQLVQRVTGERIDKSHRFTDWARRPLSEQQLTYALADVTHLREVYAHLRAALADQGRAEWVQEEMATLTSPDTYQMEPDQAWTRLKMRVRQPRDLAVLRAIAAWREREAQSRDVPRGRVLKDEALYEIAAQKPKDEAALARLRTIPRGFERSKSGRDIVATVVQALDSPKESWPEVPKGRQAPEGAGAASELLKVLLKKVAEANGVAAKVIATSDDLERIAAGETDGIPALTGWRRELFGNQALALREGRLALSFDGRRVVTFESDTPFVEAPTRRGSRRKRGKGGPAKTGSTDAQAPSSEDTEATN